MNKFSADDVAEAFYAVTLYGCSGLAQNERETLCRVFGEVMEAVLGSAEQLLALQYDYNRIVDKYFGTPLPNTASGDESALVLRWENAYRAASDAAFVAVFGDLSSISDETHFEIQPENINESGPERNQTNPDAGWPDANSGG